MAVPIPRPTSEFRTPVSFYIPVAARERLARVAFAPASVCEPLENVFPELRERGVALVAQALGLATKGKTVACPACRAERRGDHDYRLPANITPRGRWACFACGEHGDAADFLAFAHLGRRPARGDRYAWDDVAEAARKLIPFGPGIVYPRPRRTQPASPVRPRRIVDEVLHLLHTVFATEVPEVVEFLRSQDIFPARVEAEDLVRVLHPKATLWPPGAVLPDGTPWVRSQYRILLRAFDAEGRLAALVAWEIGTGEVAFPAGRTGEGLYLLNGPARQDTPKRSGMVVGVRAFLAAATMENAGPVVGVFDEKVTASQTTVAAVGRRPTGEVG